MNLLIAAISGGGLGNVLITIIVVGLICSLLWWLVSFIGLPEPFNKIARAVIAVIAVVFLINAILQATGNSGFIKW